MRKKLIVLGLITAMTFSMVACGSDDKTDNEITTAAETNENDNTKNNEEDSADDKTDIEDDAVDKKDELTDEYLLSMPETPIDELSYYEMEDGNIAIDRYIGGGGEDVIIVVPDEIEGKKVTKIAAGTFERVWAKAVVLGENISEISEKSFQSASLEKLLICGPVKTIYDGTFTKTVVEGDGVLCELLKKQGNVK